MRRNRFRHILQNKGPRALKRFLSNHPGMAKRLQARLSQPGGLEKLTQKMGPQNVQKLTGVLKAMQQQTPNL